jgi:2',3'-cyclic-nucleotide 2'-phosphodiesterase (5'-nucleotidase family)
MVGASPLISSYFHDEPTIKATNLMEFEVGTIGNHEFDEGGQEMLRLIKGGQRNDGLQFKEDVDGQPVNTSDPDFSGANYPYISANGFIATGGDGFTVFEDASATQQTLGSDLDALEAYIGSQQQVGVPADFGQRITKQG